MKLAPIVTAIVVSLVLYGLIFERDALLNFAGRDTAAEPVTEAALDDAAAETETAEDSAAEAVRVVALASEARSVESAVVLRGRTEAAREVTVAAETSGQVVSDPLRKGAFVEAGDQLCTLDPGTREAVLDETRARLTEARARLPEAEARIPAAEAALAEARARSAEGQARLLEARARLSEAEINREAAVRLSADGFASETRVASSEAGFESARAGVTSAEAALDGIASQISSAEAGVEGAKASVEGARAQIQSAAAAVAAAEREMDNLVITAPFAGLLESDAAELGSLMQPGTPCATIIQLDPIKLVGFVPETDVSKVTLGAMAGARLTDGREVRGEVTFLSRSADENTRTFRVEITVPNGDMTISDGQTAEILIASEGRSAHLIPQSALTLDDEGRIGVRAIGESNIAAFMPVTVLRDTVEGVWVTDLPEQVDIITVGQEFVIDGVTVAPTFAEAEG